VRNEALYEKCLLLEKMERYDEMMKESFKMIKPAGAKKNPFPESTFLIHNACYYDTSPNPYWLHIKALRYLGKDFSNEVEWMKRVHVNIPQYIIDDIEGGNRTVEPQIVQSIPVATETKPNPLTLTGVFGITK
jgi:hypothetical protein